MVVLLLECLSNLFVIFVCECCFTCVLETLIPEHIQMLGGK